MRDCNQLISKVIKPQIQQLVRIKDTFNDRFEYLRLDKKERLIPFDSQLFADFRDNIKFEDLSGYAELGETYHQLAKYLGVDVNQLLLASGSDLAIKSVYEACMTEGDHIVLHAPSYAMFRVYANMFGIEATTVSIKENWTIDYEEMLAQVNSRTKMLVIENPNGFVGTKPEMKDLEYCAQQLCDKDVLFMLDEAYFYIEEHKSVSHKLIAKYPNVIVSQTFSKAHGLAGLRVGYLIGHEKLIEYISRVRPMHEITSLSAYATRWVLTHPELLTANQKSIAESKKYLLEEFKKMGIESKNTHANFVMLYIPNDGKTKDLAEKLKDRKILVRRPFEESFLKGWSLICIGTLDDSKQLVKEMDNILKGN